MRRRWRDRPSTRRRSRIRGGARSSARLNPEQARAVTTTEGPVLILAGAGSGKTRVLAHRIAYLVGVQRVPPFRILAVTFTNRAAGELRERIIRLVGEPGREVQAGTFHSICAQVLRRDGEAIGLDRRFVIYDTEDQQQLMKQVLRDGGPRREGRDPPGRDPRRDQPRQERHARPEGDPAASTGDRRDRPDRAAGAALREGASRTPTRSTSTTSSSTRSACSRRRRRCSPATRSAGATSTSTSTRTRTGRSTCGSRPWRRSTATSRSSATTTSRSTAGAARTSATSSTSSATGRRPTVIKLEQNYRSTQLILDAAHAVVSKNVARTDKKLWTKNDRGRLIERFEAYNEEEEAEWIVRRVEELTGTRGSTLTRRADDGATREAARHRDPVPHERPVQGDRGGLPPLRHPLPGRRRDAVLLAARGQGRAGVPPGPPLRRGRRELRADHQRAGAGDRRQDDRGRAGVRGPRGRSVLDRAGAGGRGRDPGAGRARPGRDRRVRGAHPAAALARRRAAAAGAARRRARAVGLPGDARRRHRGGRGALGEPPRAARGHDALRRPVRGGRARPAARGDRARRRPGQLPVGRGHAVADHAARGEGPRVRGRVHRRAGGVALPDGPRRRGRGRLQPRPAPDGGGAASRLRGHDPGPRSGCTCRTPGSARPAAARARASWPSRRGSSSRSRRS